MRTELAKREGFRGTFRAVFARYGTKTAYKGPPIKTVLLTGVKFESGEAACDHVWMVCGKQFAALDPAPGAVIAFSARVRKYEKGYKGRREDYDLPVVTTDWKLSFPSHFRILEGKERTDKATKALFDPRQAELF